MNEWINKGIKRSVGLSLVLVILFWIIGAIGLNHHMNKLEANYNYEIGYLVGMVKNEHPEIANAFMEQLRYEVTPQLKARGGQVMAEYGYDLVNQEFIFDEKATRQDLFNDYFLFIGMTGVLMIFLFSMYYLSAYKKINDYTKALERLTEGDWGQDLRPQIVEGSWGQFDHMLSKLRSVMKLQVNQLEEEKDFLVQLLSDISHQLKTPLSSLMIYQELQSTGKLTIEQSAEINKQSNEQLERMEWLIKSLLKLARIDAKAIQFNMEQTDIVPVVKKMINGYTQTLIKKGLKIEMESSENFELICDSPWLQEAIGNVVNNGINHSNEGGVIKIVLEESLLCKKISIIDYGKGISPDDLPHIFKRFFRSQYNNDSQSVGIGLALTKAIVEGQGGTINSESQLGEGTKITFSFLKTTF